MSINALTTIDGVLNSLTTACKSVQLYPSNSPSVSAALKDLVNKIEELFTQDQIELPVDRRRDDKQVSEEPGEEEGPKTLDISQGLTLIVSRSGFVADDVTLGRNNDAVLRFARSIYRLDIKLIHIKRGSTEHEWREFFTVLASSIGKQDARVLDDLAKLELENIEAQGAGVLNLARRTGGGDQPDIVDYLKRRHLARMDRDNPKQAMAEGGRLLPPEFGDIDDFFLEEATGSLDMRERLFNTLDDSQRIESTLSHLLDSFEQTPGWSQGDGTSWEGLRKLFVHISESIGDLDDEKRKAYMKNTAEAVMNLPEEVRNQLVSEAVNSKTGNKSLEGSLLTFLSDDAISEVLSTNSLFHSGTAQTISNFMSDIEDDPERQSSIKSLLADKLIASSDERVRETGRLLAEDKESKAKIVPREDLSEIQKERDKIYEDQMALADQLRITDEEVQALAQDIENENLHHVDEYAAHVIVYLQGGNDPQLHTEHLLNLVEDGLSSALAGGRFETAHKILELAAQEADFPKGGEKPGQSILARAASKEHMDKILKPLRSMDKHSQDYERAIDMLCILGDRATMALFERLTSEENRSLRMFVAALLAELGEDTVAFLSKRTRHHKWYVVRNVAYMLGRVGSKSAIPALEKTLEHKDIRVRHESLKSLAAIGGKESRALMLKCLNDPDQEFKAYTAEWLGNQGIADALPPLRKTFSEQQEQLQMNPALSGAFIGALGKLGTHEDIDMLRGFSGPWWKRFSGTARKNAKLSNQAIENIKKRHGKN